MDDLQLTPSAPVSECTYLLYKVVWTNINSGQTKTMWCVSPDTRIHDECQQRWPGTHFTQYREYEMGTASRPPQVGNFFGRSLYEDGWTYGERLREHHGLT